MSITKNLKEVPEVKQAADALTKEVQAFENGDRSTDRLRHMGEMRDSLRDAIERVLEPVHGEEWVLEDTPFDSLFNSVRTLEEGSRPKEQNFRTFSRIGRQKSAESARTGGVVMYNRDMYR